MPLCLLCFAAFVHAQTPPDQCFIEGRVLNAATGEPVRNAKLRLYHQGNPAGGMDGQPDYTTSTDAKGHFAMKDIEAGKYGFSAGHAGFASMEYGARRPGRTGATLSLDAGQRVTGVVFSLTQQGVIAGRILDRDGDPLEQVNVSVVSYRYLGGKKQLIPSKSTSTDDLGEYRLFGLAPGRYYLEAVRRNSMMMFGTQERSAGKIADESNVPTYYPGTMDAANAVALEIAPGAQLRGMDFILSKVHSVRVRGHVNFADNVQRQRTMISMMPRGRNAWDTMRRGVQLDEHGNFELTDVRPGLYTITAIVHEGHALSVASQSLEVGSSNMENVQLTPSPSVEMAGLIRCEGRPPASLSVLHVTLRSGDPTEFRFVPAPGGEVREDGSFTVSNVGADVYSPRIDGLPDGYYLKSVRIGDDEVKESGIDTTRGAPGPLVVTISSRAGQIDGVVLDARQQPTAGAAVVLVPAPKLRERHEMYKQIASDQYGRFVLRSIDPGDYKLFAWEDLEPGEYMDPDFIKPVEERGVAVSIREGSRESAELKLIPAAPPAPKPVRSKRPL